jgi:hypothetical protein
MPKLPSRLICLALVVCASAVVIAQNQQPPGTGLVVGRVVDAASNRPIAGAMVTIGSLPAPMPPAVEPTRRVVTDSDGRFLFRDLRKGAYTFTATAPGYLDGGFGQRVAEGSVQPFALDEGQPVGMYRPPVEKRACRARCVMSPAARGEDRRDDPAARDGWRTDATVVAARLVGTARTDDRGAFELPDSHPATTSSVCRRG